jgi:hypothetical protein
MTRRFGHRRVQHLRRRQPARPEQLADLDSLGVAWRRCAQFGMPGFDERERDRQRGRQRPAVGAYAGVLPPATGRRASAGLGHSSSTTRSARRACSRIRARARPAALAGAIVMHTPRTPASARAGPPGASAPALPASLHDASCVKVARAPSRHPAGPPYHGSALPTELRGRKTCKCASHSRPKRLRASRPCCRDTARGAIVATARGALAGEERSEEPVHAEPSVKPGRSCATTAGAQDAPAPASDAAGERFRLRGAAGARWLSAVDALGPLRSGIVGSGIHGRLIRVARRIQ